MNKIKRLLSIFTIVTVTFTFSFCSLCSTFASTEGEDAKGTATTTNVDENNGLPNDLSSNEIMNNEKTTSNANDANGSDGSTTGNIENTNNPETPETPETPDVKEPELKSGAVEEDGKWYYYTVTTDSKGNKKSVRKTGTGWIKENGVRTYYLYKGVLATGWKNIKTGNKKTYKYYFGADGKSTPVMSRGVTLINGIGYYFVYSSSSASVGNLYKSGFVRDKNENLVYATNSAGKLKTGFVAYKNRAYYLSNVTDSSIGLVKYKPVKNYTVNRNITIGSSGYIGGTRGKALYYGIKALDKNGWSLRSAYKYSYKIRYANRKYRPKTVATGAVYGFSKRKGNCYVMNCCFHVMADLMGYEVRQVKSSVGWWRAPHSWLEINQDDKWYVYDANFRNETGRNGFKIYYGKKGTWRYNRSTKYLKKY